MSGVKRRREALGGERAGTSGPVRRRAAPHSALGLALRAAGCQPAGAADDAVPTDIRGPPVLPICNTQNRSRATLRALRERGDDCVRRGRPLATPGT